MGIWLRDRLWAGGRWKMEWGFDAPLLDRGPRFKRRTKLDAGEQWPHDAGEDNLTWDGLCVINP